jgi:two-component system, chemotaxis family, CheB/CheR fusion protein
MKRKKSTIRSTPRAGGTTRRAGSSGRLDGLAGILVLLRRAFGTDFTEYKDATVRRRIQRRMALHRLEEPEAYLRRLRTDPAEAERLYQDILIKVTSFLRDPGSFEVLRARVFPAIVESRSDNDPIRVWVPGCSTGEEAYSVAICLLEFLGARRITAPIQIFGTDVSHAAIEKARAGAYPEIVTRNVPPERLRRFFKKAGGGYRIDASVREQCIFARHDLTKDPPFSRMDLVSCRNLLIYLSPAVQQRVLSRLHYSLKPERFLMLGSAETPGFLGEHFRLLDRSGRIYVKKATTLRPRFDLPPQRDSTRPGVTAGGGSAARGKPAFDALEEADRIVQMKHAPAGVLVSEGMEVLQFRGRTSPYLEPSPGAASFNLLKMAHEDLLPGLRAAIRQARREGSPAGRERVKVRADGRTRTIDLKVYPIRNPDDAGNCFLVLFERPGPPQPGAPASPEAPGRSRAARGGEREAAELRREIAATRDYLQSIVEEQEATNEELKSANEEILSSNEELRSTNEELETAQEELQSRHFEIVQANNDLLNLLSSINIPVIMLATDLKIRRFTPQAQKALNLLPGDVGRPITDIRLNLDLPDLEERVLRTIRTGNAEQAELQDKEGRWHSLRIRPYRTSDGKLDGAILVLVDIDELRRHAAEMEASQARLEAEIAEHRRAEDRLQRFKFISDGSNDAHELVDREGRLLYVNRRAWERLGYTEEEMLRMRLWDIEPSWSEERFEELFRRLERMRVPPFESVRRRKDGTTFPVEVGVTGVNFAGERCLFVVARDIAERKRVERRLELAVESAPNAMVMVNQEGTILLVNAQTEKLFGYFRGEMIGRPVEMLIPARFRAAHGEFRKGFLADPQARPMGGGRALYALRKDGTEVPVEIGLNPIETDEGTWVLGAIVDISERKRAEDALRKAHEELELRVQERTAALNLALEELQLQFAQRRGLLARMTQVQDEERRRLARELHDSTGQNLVAMKMDLGRALEKAGPLDSKLQEILARCLELADESIRDIRTMSYLLYPPLLEERGLASAVRQYAEGFSRRSGIDVTLDFPEDLGRLSPEVELAGFRVVQECLINVHRHSKSSTARVRMERGEKQMTLEVSDAGLGLQVPDAGQPGEVEIRGIGIRGMRERVQNLGGSFELDSSPSGTRVRAVLPLEPDRR